MQLGYIILYVTDVEEALTHYQRAFGCKVLMIHESKQYGELDTGGTILAMASYEVAEVNGVEIQRADPSAAAPSVEIVFIAADVDAAYQRAVAHGAEPVKAPEDKPWDQTVAYVRDANGYLVEIASPLHDRHR